MKITKHYTPAFKKKAETNAAPNIILINKKYKRARSVFYLDSNSNFNFSVSHFAFYCRFNLLSFAHFFLCIRGFSSTASPPSLYLRSRFSIHLSFCKPDHWQREQAERVVERMMMVLPIASESVIFTLEKY